MEGGSDALFRLAPQPVSNHPGVLRRRFRQPLLSDFLASRSLPLSLKFFIFPLELPCSVYKPPLKSLLGVSIKSLLV